MKIIVDENIALAEEAFSSLGNVELYHGRKIIPSVLKNADILIVRSITNINKNLIEGSNVKFVGTATIGTDHIDKEYLASENISFSDAAGCNSHAVKEYVFTALLNILVEKKLFLKDLTIGIIGIGNIGSKAARLAEILGMKVLKNDPPVKRKTGRKDFVELEEIIENADVISLHVPLTLEGEDKTFHLFDDRVLKKLKDNVILINSSRGAVIDNEALNKIINEKKINAVLDVWENEPEINTGLLQKVRFASPHIAGYTLEGKVNGTVMIYNSLCKFLSVKPEWKPKLPEVENSDIMISENLSPYRERKSVEKTLCNIFNQIYSIESDTEKMRGIICLEKEKRGKFFDQSRKNYNLRREFNNYSVSIDKSEKFLTNILKEFRFQIKLD